MTKTQKRIVSKTTTKTKTKTKTKTHIKYIEKIQSHRRSDTDQIHRENTITSSIRTDMVRTAFEVLPGRATFFCFFLEPPWRL
jgi:hypothetical protein